MTPEVKTDTQAVHLCMSLRWQGELHGHWKTDVLNMILHLFPQSCLWSKHRLQPYSTHRIKSVVYFPTKSRCRVWASDLQTFVKCQRSSTSEKCLFFKTIFGHIIACFPCISCICSDTTQYIIKTCCVDYQVAGVTQCCNQKLKHLIFNIRFF